MKPWLGMSTASFLTCLSLWMFQETLSQTLLDEEAIRKSAIYDYKIRVGNSNGGDCSVDIWLTTWDSLNQLEIYKWVVACEQAKEESK